MEPGHYTRYKNQIGAILGYPTSIYYKRNLSPSISASITAGWEIPDSFYGTLNLLFNTFNVIAKNVLLFYFGPGFGFGVSNQPVDRVHLGALVPVGIEFQYKRLAIALQIAPGIGLFPAVAFIMQGGLAVAFLF